jgi:hypothetical protein
MVRSPPAARGPVRTADDHERTARTGVLQAVQKRLEAAAVGGDPGSLDVGQLGAILLVHRAG